MSERAGVVNKHLAVDMSEANTMTMLYKIDDGFVQEQHYGLTLACVIDLPPQVLKVAEKVSKTLAARIAAKKQSSQAYALTRRRRLVLNLKEMLVQAQNSPMDDRAMSSWLLKLQSEFVRQMDALENDIASNDTEGTSVEDEEQDGQEAEDMSVDDQASQIADKHE
jgi:DNA mismatch repair protein MSH4